ncbi:MAG: winged helix DNA-binding domain-containing protein [Nocardioidaceae bacterium]
MRHITDDERRARLARRHAFAPGHRATDPVAAARAMTVLHATESASVYLALWARVEGLTVADVDRVLYADRTLVRQLAMRRTIFVFPRDLLPAAWGSASARVAAQLRPRLVKEIEKGGIAADGEAWLEAAEAAVLARLADGSELPAQTLREQVPELDGRIEISAGKAYGGVFPIAPRVLTQLSVERLLVRGRNATHWRVSRPLWTLMERWLGEPPVPVPAPEGWAELARRWLRTFGPGTAADLQWWLGATVGIVKAALAEVHAVEVTLDGGATGWVLPDDLDPVAPVEPWAALLPVLDPTVMGWKARDFYLGPHSASVFDSNGNGGTTAWWDGRIVGCWLQDDAGRVEVFPLEDLDRDARSALDAEADRLTGWLDGEVVPTLYTAPAVRAARRSSGES